MRISDWSSDVCSSDLLNPDKAIFDRKGFNQWIVRDQVGHLVIQISHEFQMTRMAEKEGRPTIRFILCHRIADRTAWNFDSFHRSEEHTSELQSLMRISYAVFCLKKKKIQERTHMSQTPTN